jgi:putative nucleotidyltransferase with HDIG domain
VSNNLKLYIAVVVAASAIALAATTILVPVDPRISPVPGAADVALGIGAGITLWTVITVLLSALPVTLPNGNHVAVATAPIVVAMVLGGPTAAGWVAMIGVTELREVRGRIPWYGTLFNHAGVVLPAIAGGMLVIGLRGAFGAGPGGVLEDFTGSIVGATVYFGLNLVLVSVTVAARTERGLSAVLRDDAGLYTNLLTLAPLAWLMAQMYLVAWWASLLFAIPLYTTRVAYQRFVDMLETFEQTISALAAAVDARDPFTARHSERVKDIAVDIAVECGVRGEDLRTLRWGGLLHDIGKIGVEDAVLLKPDRLNKDERAKMNAHPVTGANIISPVSKLAPTIPIIRHHHEWYNGSGYPDRLLGEGIPWLARILHVADAFEAMTKERPYRMVPLTPEQALAELRKYAGIQFDPKVVDAFARTKWAAGIPDPGRPLERQPIPMLSQAASRMARAGATPVAGTATDSLADPGAAGDSL